MEMFPRSGFLFLHDLIIPHVIVVVVYKDKFGSGPRNSMQKVYFAWHEKGATTTAVELSHNFVVL